MLESYRKIAELAQIPGPDFSVDFLGLAQAFAAKNASDHSTADEKIGIIHVGEMSTSITVIRKGYPIFFRHLLNASDKELIESTCIEAARSLDYFYENSGIEALDQIVVSGGKITDQGFQNALSQSLKSTITLGDPLQGLAVKGDAESGDTPHLFAVAVGLAKISCQAWTSARLEAGFF